MEELPNLIPKMSVVWNKHRVIPPTSTYTITISVETSVDVESIRTWLLEMLGGTLQSIAVQTRAEEKLISIETIKL